MFKVVWLIFFALIRAIAHQRLIFLKDEGSSLMSLCYRLLKTCFHKG